MKTMSVFTAGCDRDLKREEAAASMAVPAGATKKKEPAASMTLPTGATKKEAGSSMAVPAGATKKKEPAASMTLLTGATKMEDAEATAEKKRREEATAEARLAGAGKKMEDAEATAKKRKEAPEEKKMREATAEKKRKEPVASEPGDIAPKNEKDEECDSLFKEGEMLRLREEHYEVDLLWKHKMVPGALDRWLERKKTTQVPAANNNNKKKKVVRIITPNAYIESIIENPVMMKELSDEEMAKCPENYRQSFAIAKLINAKKRLYQEALIAQYRAFGFAYDEKEVTDDDEKEEVAAVKN